MKKMLLFSLVIAAFAACKNENPKTESPAPPPTMETNTKTPEINTDKVDLGKVQQGVATGKDIQAQLNELSAELNKLPASVKKQRKAEVDETREMLNTLLEKSKAITNDIRVVEVLKKQGAEAPVSRQTEGLQQQRGDIPTDAANPEEASLIKGVQESKQSIYLLDENIKTLNEYKTTIEELKAKVAKLKQ